MYVQERQEEKFMEKNVIISVTSVQRDENGRDEKISLETPGVYGERDGMQYLSYEETKLAGMEGTTTTLQIYDDHVSLLREGTFLQEQEYCLGKPTVSQYRTPMGVLEVRVLTREIENTIRDGRGQMRLAYDVELKGLFNHFNEIIVKVREEPHHSWKSETN